VFRPPNGMGAKLHGRGPRAEALVARRLPRILLDSNARSAADVTPRRWCSAEALQRRTEAGPCQLQRLVRRHRLRSHPSADANTRSAYLTSGFNSLSFSEVAFVYPATRRSSVMAST
jgi:hypothetical protein